MSDGDGDAVAAHYSSLTHSARTQLGCLLRAPFMTLSFMALLVIPALKLSDKGLFDSQEFRFTDVVCP
jgi:adenine deaminase